MLLNRRVTASTAEHFLLTDNRESFAARLSLINGARHSLYVQTYLLHDDETGRYFLSALRQAAQRGVNVCLLLDDLDVFAREDLLRYFAEHPLVQLRLFNPFAGRRFPRWSRFLSLVFDHGHFGRRMHNKVLIADETTMIVGGRNIGNAYFDAPAGINFFDLDVMTRGNVVNQAVLSFKRYWQHRTAVPIQQLHATTRSQLLLKQQRKRLHEWLHQGTGERCDWAATQQQFDTTIANDVSRWQHAEAEWLADEPDKITHTRRSSVAKPGEKLFELLLSATHSATLVSPYFVPRRRGVKLLQALQKRGVHVSVLTNSLSATDVPLVHGGYERYRQRLLAAGIALFELKALKKTKMPWQSLRHSHASLHAKTYVFDRTHIVIGSLNLDPRSLSINTECGLIIHSSALAQSIEALFAQACTPHFSYSVSLQHGKLRWHDAVGEYTSEPHVGIGRRLVAFLARALPIEGQL